MRGMAVYAAAAALAGMTGLAQDARAIGFPCSNANLNGAYSVRISGFIGRQPLAGSAILVFDGAGTVTAASVGAFSRDFNVFQSVRISGNYVVNSNCTGAMSLTTDLGNGSQHYDIAVNSTGFVGIQTDFNTSVTLDAKP